MIYQAFIDIIFIIVVHLQSMLKETCFLVLETGDKVGKTRNWKDHFGYW